MKPLELLDEHCLFANVHDVYVLLGVARKKDNKNITNSQEVVFREIIKDYDNIEKKYTKLKTQCENYKTADDKKLNFYIYISVNGRDVRKGYFAFKNQMLKYEKEILFGTDCHNQLKRVDSIWLSAIMKPESRSLENRRFMLDIDTKDVDKIKIIETCISNIGGYIMTRQATKHGWHYITKPFNKQEFNKHIFSIAEKDDCEIKDDALLFVEHIEGDEK